MQVTFTEDHVLVIHPENSVEQMALKYWLNEYAEHGDRVLEVGKSIQARHNPRPHQDTPE